MCVRVGNRKGVVKLGGWRATRSTQHPGKGRLLAIVTDSNRDVMCRKARKDARGPARAKGVIFFHCFITSRVCDSRDRRSCSTLRPPISWILALE